MSYAQWPAKRIWRISQRHAEDRMQDKIPLRLADPESGSAA